jgi:hypothetical protein
MRTSHTMKRHPGRHPALKAALLIAGLLLASAAWAALPPPTPAQQQAAADKKAKADAQAAKDKLSLAASMDAATARWRTRAGQEGWKAHPAVAVVAAAPAAAPAAGAAPVTAAGRPARRLRARLAPARPRPRGRLLATRQSRAKNWAPRRRAKTSRSADPGPAREREADRRQGHADVKNK